MLVSAISSYGTAPGQVRSPAGIALDSQRRLLVASPNTGRVEVFGLDCFTQLAATPASRTAPVGATVTFSALPACTGPFAFQWRKGTNDLADGGIVSGVTNATLVLTGVTTNDAGTYSVAVTGPEGTSFSPEASLTVINAPAIITSPAGKTVPVGTTIVLNASRAALTWSGAGSTDRLKAARKFGSDKVIEAKEVSPSEIREINHNRLADLVIVFAGTASAYRQALETTERGGMVLCFAPIEPGLSFSLPFFEFWNDGITLSPTYGGSPLDLLEAIRIDWSSSPSPP